MVSCFAWKGSAQGVRSAGDGSGQVFCAWCVVSVLKSIADIARARCTAKADKKIGGEQFWFAL